MKVRVAINSCHGGFGLSLAAAKRLYVLGEPPAWQYYDAYCEEKKVLAGSDEWFEHRYYTISRINPNLIQTILELGDAANGDCSRLSVLEVDIEALIADKIESHDGYERLEIPRAVEIMTTDRD
jgi:hypothetical protein